MANEHTDRIEAARVYGESLTDKGISGKIVSGRNGVRVEIDHIESSRHAENAISWEDLDRADDDELIKIIDDLVSAVA